MADKETTLTLLREHHIAPLVALELPDDDLITEVEEMIYVQIRGDLRSFLLEASDLVLGALEPITVTDSGSHTYLPEVASNAWEQGVSRELLPICQTSDRYYCLDMEDHVVLWEEGNTTGDVWLNIWAWAEEVWLES